MVFVLPLLLYPILGIGDPPALGDLRPEGAGPSSSSGAENLPASPPLLNAAQGRLRALRSFSRPKDAALLKVERADARVRLAEARGRPPRASGAAWPTP